MLFARIRLVNSSGLVGSGTVCVTRMLRNRVVSFCTLSAGQRNRGVRGGGGGGQIVRERERERHNTEGKEKERKAWRTVRQDPAVLQHLAADGDGLTLRRDADLVLDRGTEIIDGVVRPER